VRGNFFADETIAGLAGAQARAVSWCTDVAGMRIHGTIQTRPAQVFAAHEAHLLLPVPGPYDVPVFSRVKVHRDFDVEVARSLYSAPQQYLGRHLDARADSQLVKLYHRGVLVKTHPRAEPGRRVTDPADLPAEKTTYAMRDVESLARSARRSGLRCRKSTTCTVFISGDLAVALTGAGTTTGGLKSTRTCLYALTT
jgi:hypothetical protein